ncbi:ferredoxin [Clostridium sp.]|uniref:ferredoxin n=1 Tax=Clostridium sp. TaxID=1506 RepID=UPI002634CD8C|nr:ferredoxin [Clostridium sp.]
MKASVDQETCIGCGLCPSICGDVFEMNDDGKAYAKQSDVPGNLEADAKEAEESCPVDAIKVE